MVVHMPEYRWRWVPAVLIVFTLVVLACFYVIDRLTNLLGFGNFWISLILALTLTILLPLVMLLPGITPNTFTNALWILISTVFGLMFSVLTCLLFFELASLFFDLPDLDSGLAILVIVAVVAAISFANAQRLVSRTIRLRSFPVKVRAVQLTDLHIGSVHGDGYLRKIVEMVNSLEPEMVFITGDILSGATRVKKGQFDELNEVKARIIMVPGNHEYYDGIDDILGLLSTTKVEVLRDELVDMGRYQILGLDFSGNWSSGDDLPEGIELDGRPVITLSHVPGMRKLPRNSLILSVHYHAGQIFPLNFLVGILIKYGKGLYEKDGVHLYVSPGTATWGPPMRFGSSNEVTLLDLGPE